MVWFGRLRVFKTEDDITLKISDRGGGIPRRRRGKIFTYMYSTAPKVRKIAPVNIRFIFLERKPFDCKLLNMMAVLVRDLYLYPFKNLWSHDFYNSSTGI
jgi:hypothetical protein